MKHPIMWLFWLGVLILLLPTLVGCTGCGEGYSEGERTGVITKISRKGLIWKSWEGEILIGGISPGQGGTMIPRVGNFSVVDEAVVKKLQDAATSGKSVTVQYRQWAIAPSSIDTDYVVTGVK